MLRLSRSRLCMGMGKWGPPPPRGAFRHGELLPTGGCSHRIPGTPWITNRVVSASAQGLGGADEPHPSRSREDNSVHAAVVPTGMINSYGSPPQSNGTPVNRGNGSPPEHSTWVPQDVEKLRKMARQSLLHEMWQKQQRTHEVAVDWFLSNMPATYFRQTTEEARLEHLGAICAMIEPRFFFPVDRFENGHKEVTFIQPGAGSRRDGILALLHSLPPADGTLQQVKVFPSRDGNLAINVFGYRSTSVLTPREDPSAPDHQDPSPENCELATMPMGWDAGAGAGAGAREGEGLWEGGELAGLYEYASALQRGDFLDDDTHPRPDPMFEPQALASYVSLCEPDYVQSSHPRRFCKQLALYKGVSGTENVAVDVEEYTGEEHSSISGVDWMVNSHWITLTSANVLPKVALAQVLRLLKSYELQAIRCHLDVVNDPGNGTVTMIRLLVSTCEGESAGGQRTWDQGYDDKEVWESISKDLRRLKWLDELVFDLALDRHPGLGLEKVEVIVSLANMVYGALHKQNPWAYSKSQIYEWLANPRYVKHAEALADLLFDRFRPEDPLPPGMVEEKAGRIRQAVRRDVEHVVAQGLLEKMLDAVLATYRTNLYMPNRWALSLRVDPRLLMPAETLEKEDAAIPFGVFFAHGRRFNGFHCRFRDIARGGMRIVSPPTSEQVAIEAGRQFDETYALAYAQQLKNKDIPEGGSKAVLLVDTTHSTEGGRHHAIRKGVKAFSDSLLDLLVDTPETKERVVDFWGRQELLYLGPDEQVIPQDINWVVTRAAQRGAPFPSAFMSSKPDAGINHKDYGVTSEGVFVFLDEALRNAGINPQSGQSFSIKITGGPDGDVGGNMINILHREYGEACRIVGVADGTGSAEDQDGLSHTELLRLFQEGKPIAQFRFNKLGPRGSLHTCDTDEGVRARNTMHNRVRSDAFVPAGGRPNTINKTNWREFLGSDGTPSSPLVVEGANLFTTPEARELLFHESKVDFVKDSSANKCGVICSSFEIITSMLMPQEEFTDNKDVIVTDVLERLRSIARREAELLFREHRNDPALPLPRLSERISNAINAVTDAVLAILDKSPEEHNELLLPLFHDHLPRKIRELAFDRVPTVLPAQYLRNAMASCLASRVVYTEGVNFVDAQPKDRLGLLALEYINTEGHIRDLADAVQSGDRALGSAERKEVADILRAAGVRARLKVY